MCAELVEAPFDRLRAHGDKCALRAHGNHARSGLISPPLILGLPQPTA